MESIEAQVHFAVCAIRDDSRFKKTTLENETEFEWSKCCTRDVNDQLNSDLKEQGNVRKDDEIKTRTTTNTLQVLGYEFIRGAGSKSYFHPDSSEDVFKRCVRKYGLRGLSRDDN